MRKCPECNQRFLFDQSAAAERGAELDEIRGRKIACCHCMRSFIPMMARRKNNKIECQFCESLLDITESEVFYGQFRKAEKKVRKGLLLGVENEVILRGVNRYLARMPNGMESACRLLKHQQDRIPFLRWEVTEFSGCETEFFRPPGLCDECRQQPPEHHQETEAGEQIFVVVDGGGRADLWCSRHGDRCKV